MLGAFQASHLTETRNHRDIVDCMVGRPRDTARFFRVGELSDSTDGEAMPKTVNVKEGSTEQVISDCT